MNALAPAVSQILASANANAGADLFSSSLCLTDPAAKQGLLKQIGGSMAMDMAHCGYCLPHGGSDMIEPVMFSGLGLSVSHGLRPFLFYRSPAPLLALTAAPPRGPPVFA